MPATPRPRRSLLFMPGSNPRALEKARALPADGLIFDLEDAVAPEAKESARTIVAAALAEGGYGGRELVIRVNAIDTPWGHADLAAAATMPIDAVLLPKVENPDRVALTRVAARRVRGSGAARSLVHAGDAARHPLCPRDRRSEPEARRARSRHLGPDQRPARAPDPRSSAADYLPQPRHSGSPRPRAGGSRRRPPRPLRR